MLKDKLIDDAKRAHKLWSVWYNAAMGVVVTVLLEAPGTISSVIGSLPGSLQDKVPVCVGIALIVAGTAVRLWKQGHPDQAPDNG